MMEGEIRGRSWLPLQSSIALPWGATLGLGHSFQIGYDDILLD